MTHRCRGAVYFIRVTNALKDEKPRLVVGGNAIEGTLVPYAEAGETVEVTCKT